MRKRSLWKQASLSTEAFWGTRGEVCLMETSRDSKRGLWKLSVCVSLYGSSVRGTWREGSFTGDPEGYVKKGSGNGCLCP